MKTEIIVKKPYPFCPKEVGEKLEEKGNTYCIMQLFENITSLYYNIDEIKQDPILMQFLEIKENKSIEDYIEKTFYNIKEKTVLLNAYSISRFLDKTARHDAIVRRFFNSELLRTIAEDLNEGWKPDFYNTNQPKHSLYYYFKEKKYGITKSMVTFDLNVVYFKSEAIAEQAIELMGEERLNTLR